MISVEVDVNVVASTGKQAQVEIAQVDGCGVVVYAAGGFAALDSDQLGADQSGVQADVDGIDDCCGGPVSVQQKHFDPPQRCLTNL